MTTYGPQRITINCSRFMPEHWQWLRCYSFRHWCGSRYDYQFWKYTSIFECHSWVPLRWQSTSTQPISGIHSCHTMGVWIIHSWSLYLLTYHAPRRLIVPSWSPTIVGVLSLSSLSLEGSGHFYSLWVLCAVMNDVKLRCILWYNRTARWYHQLWLHSGPLRTWRAQYLFGGNPIYTYRPEI